jgi:hypothetical protein
VAFVAATGARAGAARAGSGAARKKAASRKAAAGPNLNDLAPSEVEEELQRRKKVAAIRKQRRDAGLSEGQTVYEQEQEQADDAASSSPSSGGRFRLEPVRPRSSAAGFVLGLGAWALAVNMLRGGPDQVRRFLAAKFLNKTGA